MIHKLSRKIATWLISYDLIEDDDSDLYEYILYNFLFSLLPLVIALLGGSILGITVEGFVFILPYILLRNFCGGYHFESIKVCLIVSIPFLCISLLFAKYVASIGLSLLLLFFIILSSGLIFSLSPIDATARNLSEAEKRVFKKNARVLVCIFTFLILLLYIFEQYSLANSAGLGVIVTAILQIPCCIMK